MVQRTQLVSRRMQVRSLASLSGLRIQHCLELWGRSRHSLDPVLLWLWCRLAAAAPIGPLAWELTYWVQPYKAKKKKKKKKKTQKKKLFFFFLFFFFLGVGVGGVHLQHAEVPGQGSNLHHRSNPSHSSNNAGSFTH